ncbi:hypothetical protein CAJAP_08189 [Camponotus japonicus]
MYTTYPCDDLPGRFSCRRAYSRLLSGRPDIKPQGFSFLIRCWDKVGRSIWGNACLVRRAPSSQHPVITIRLRTVSWTRPRNR